MAHLHLTTAIAAPPQLCYELSLSIDTHLRSMADSGEEVIGERRHGLLREGEEVTWRARHFGVRFTMTSVIEQCDPPRGFVDRQRRGPFKRWHHRHDFRSTPAGTEMIDEVEWSAPFGPIGVLAERLVLERYLRNLLLERNAWIKAAAEGGGVVEADHDQ